MGGIQGLFSVKAKSKIGFDPFVEVVHEYDVCIAELLFT